MATTGTVAGNYAIVLGIALVSLIGIAFRVPYAGLIFAFPVGAVMMILGYLVSYYINALVDSHRRATVLSFKGLFFNLGYGFISLLFALVLRAGRDHRSNEEALAFGFRTLPLWLLLVAAGCTLLFWKQRAALRHKIIQPSEKLAAS
jgi:hypothetical protein